MSLALLTLRKINRIIFIYFGALILTLIYIFFSKENIKDKIENQYIEDIIQQYTVYKKTFLLSHNLKSILIKNEDYIDNTELIDEFASSTPFILEKKDKNIARFSIVFAFFEKNKKQKEEIQKKIDSLKNNDYKVKIDKKHISLFGTVFDEGYINITKYTGQDYNTKDSIDYLFDELLVFALINILMFIYSINLLKKNQKNASEMLEDFNELKKNTQKLAFEDTLTKAATRLKFNEVLNNAMQIASRFKQNKFGIIMMDIDNFKNINDTYGHDYGDLVLKSLSSIIKKFIRVSDTFARWGGEEFVLLTPMNNLEQTHQLAEKLRIAIYNIKFEKVKFI